MPKLTLAEAGDLVVGALVAAGTSDANARSVSRALVLAEADGLKGHGLSRLPSYAAQARVGKVDGRAVPALARAGRGVLLVDAAHGFAYPALDLAVGALPSVTQESGVAAAALRRSHHCGAAGHPVERLAEQGMVALLFANTPSAIAPQGGRRAVFGTNPIAFACPLPGRPPVVIDMALSVVARGNIIAAKQRGEAIPEGWALDADGRPTTDPEAALAGTMMPLGGAKGAALALMVELLAAGLTGATYAADASSFMDAAGGPPGTGQLILCLDPAALGGPGTLGRFAALAASIEAQEGARLPGARRLESRAKSAREGLAISDRLLAEIRAIG